MWLRRCATALVLVVSLVACREASLETEVRETGSIEERLAQIRAIGERAVEEEGLVGLSIAVSIGGEVEFAGGFGHSDLDRRHPADENTIYDIASVGKQFTAAAVLQLAERGAVRLDERVRDVVPEVPQHFPNATIEQLLRHASGFVDGDVNELDPPDSYQQQRRSLELLEDPPLRDGVVEFEPGRAWLYSNSGYVVLGAVVEKVSGRPYTEVVSKLLSSVGIDSITVGRRAASPRMAEALRRSEDGVDRVPFVDMSAYGGAGSVCSSVADLLRWSRALSDGRVISAASLGEMRSPSVLQGDHSAAEIPYGMGQRMGALGGHAKVGHTGTFDGGSAVLAHYPEMDIEIAVASNTRGQGVPHAREIERRLARLLLGLEPSDPLTPLPISPEEKVRIEGLYRDRVTYEAQVDGDELVIRTSGKEAGRLVHVGDLRFRSLSRPHVEEWFEMDGETAGWWAVAYDGFLGEVSRRVDEAPEE